jgi:hypothetical protein
MLGVSCEKNWSPVVPRPVADPYRTLTAPARAWLARPSPGIPIARSACVVEPKFADASDEPNRSPFSALSSVPGASSVKSWFLPPPRPEAVP